MLSERESGTPLEVVVGWAEFLRLRIRIAPGVFVPRRRTELLVALALERLGEETGIPLRALDLCCGSGAAGTALATAHPDLEVWAADLDPAAVACARANLTAARPDDGGAADRVREGDLFAALPASLRAGFDVVVANAPYVPSGEVEFLPPEARLFEPSAALDGGPDGTALHERIARESADWLRPGGIVLVETGVEQAAVTAGHFERAGFEADVVRSDALDGTAVRARLR